MVSLARFTLLILSILTIDAWAYGCTHESGLNTDRVSADWQIVQRGTMQHEIFGGYDLAAYIEIATIRLKVNCRADAGRLDERVPYGLAMTLVPAEALRILVHQEVAKRTNPQHEVRAV